MSIVASFCTLLPSKLFSCFMIMMLHFYNFCAGGAVMTVVVAVIVAAEIPRIIHDIVAD
jgi:hypothetical protein